MSTSNKRRNISDSNILDPNNSDFNENNEFSEEEKVCEIEVLNGKEWEENTKFDPKLIRSICPRDEKQQKELQQLLGS
ncbi:17915_t:CDS:2 [Gigaspora margarita]|uniref:17915_t:CDS:1 n=1 Tax=Gigaspora margarita TaxID=4874 RepID=A0ABN7UC00_GIGMA|nr:17915_t:CDS:2 [Gigaspora margarita]